MVNEYAVMAWILVLAVLVMCVATWGPLILPLSVVLLGCGYYIGRAAERGGAGRN